MGLSLISQQTPSVARFAKAGQLTTYFLINKEYLGVLTSVPTTRLGQPIKTVDL